MMRDEFVAKYLPKVVGFCNRYPESLQVTQRGITKFLEVMYERKKHMMDSLPFDEDLRYRERGVVTDLENLRPSYPHLAAAIEFVGKVLVYKEFCERLDKRHKELGLPRVIRIGWNAPDNPRTWVLISEAWRYLRPRVEIAVELDGRTVIFKTMSVDIMTFFDEGRWGELMSADEIRENYLDFPTTPIPSIKMRLAGVVDFMQEQDHGLFCNIRCLASDVHDLFRYMKVEMGASTAHDARCRIGEVIKGSGLTAVVSLNPVDFLKASVDCSYGSCFRPGGEYFNGCIAYAVDPEMLISYVTSSGDDSYKIGRRWLRLRSLFDGFYAIFGRQYGTFPMTSAKLLLPFLTPTATQAYGEGRWRKSAFNCRYYCSSTEDGDDCSDDTTALYLDSGAMAYVYNQDGSTREDFAVKMTAAYCLMCGVKTQNSEGGCCSDCSPSRCYCTSCEDRHSRDDMMMSPSGDYYCGDCFYEYYFNCDSCSEYADREEQVTVSGHSYPESWCADCVDRHAFTCDACGDSFSTAYHNSIDLQDGETWCSRCFTDNGFTCRECGEECSCHQNEMSNDRLCDECYEDQQAEEE